ncbi:hypothetical protein GCM10023158_29100 [Gluconacetobacter tumulicola]
MALLRDPVAGQDDHVGIVAGLQGPFRLAAIGTVHSLSISQDIPVAGGLGKRVGGRRGAAYCFLIR